MSKSLPILKVLSHYIFLKSLLPFLLFFLFPIMYLLFLLMISCKFHRLFHSFSFFFLLFLWQFWISSLWVHWFFCLTESAVQALYWILWFSRCILHFQNLFGSFNVFCLFLCCTSHFVLFISCFHYFPDFVKLFICVIFITIIKNSFSGNFYIFIFGRLVIGSVLWFFWVVSFLFFFVITVALCKCLCIERISHFFQTLYMKFS